MHYVESMFSVREKPWHYSMTKDVTKILQDAPNSAEALRLAGLDWNVIQKDIQLKDENGDRIPGYKANVRSSDNRVLGVVSDRYRIVQNTEAFAFTDELIGGDVRYETAGSLQNGKKVWLLARLPDTKLVGDDVESYVCFSNTHDGSGSVRVCMTPIRVVCNNTLNLALSSAKRAWSTPHVGDVQGKIREARQCLELAEDYMDSLAEYADKLANTKLEETKLREIIDEMFAVPEDETDRKKANAQAAKDSFMVCYFAPDIAKFRGTAWGAVNAMSDMVSHAAPARNTGTYAENNWGRIMDGHALLDQLVAKVGKFVED